MMITREQLLAFVSPDECRNISKPFSHGPWTYATDGMIAIRLPRLDEVPEHADMKATPGAIEKLFSDDWPLASFQPVPDAGDAPPQVTCSECGGTGTISKCWKCKGTGKSVCGECCAEKPCAECGGAGTWAPMRCLDCDGVGTVPAHDSESPLVIDGTHLRRKYVRLIAALPGSAIAVKRGGFVAAFKFDGGDGRLATMREQ